MELYNHNTDTVEDITSIKTSQGSLYVDKMTTSALNFNGYYTIIEEQEHNKRYYINNKVYKLENNVYQISYEKSNRPIEEIKELMSIDLDIASNNYQDNAVVDSDMGFVVQGGMKGANRMNIGKKHGRPEIRDINKINHAITPREYDLIIELIESKEIELQDIKWSKEDAISNMITAEECELYENEVFIENGIEKIKNNIKEW